MASLCRFMTVCLVVRLWAAEAVSEKSERHLAGGLRSTALLNRDESVANSTFVPIWALAAPWLLDSQADGRSSWGSTRRHQASAQHRDQREESGSTQHRDRHERRERSAAPNGRQEQETEPREMSNERYFAPTPWRVNKLYLAAINIFGFGTLGCDRCFMNQVTIGVIKGVTLGGCGIWACADYIVLTVNCLMFWTSISALGYEAEFLEDTITYAFGLTLIIFLLKCIIHCAECAGFCGMSAAIMGLYRGEPRDKL